MKETRMERRDRSREAELETIKVVIEGEEDRQKRKPNFLRYDRLLTCRISYSMQAKALPQDISDHKLLPQV